MCGFNFCNASGLRNARAQRAEGLAGRVVLVVNEARQTQVIEDFHGLLLIVCRLNVAFVFRLVLTVHHLLQILYA